MEYYSALQRDEVMPFADTWMHPEMITLSKVGWVDKDKDHVIALTCGFKNTNGLIEHKQTHRHRKWA